MRVCFGAACVYCFLEADGEKKGQPATVDESEEGDEQSEGDLLAETDKRKRSNKLSLVPGKDTHRRL